MQDRDLQIFLLENCEFVPCPKGWLSVKHLSAYKSVRALTKENEGN